MKVPLNEGSMNVFQNPTRTTATARHAAVKKYRLLCVGSFMAGATSSVLHVEIEIQANITESGRESKNSGRWSVLSGPCSASDGE